MTIAVDIATDTVIGQFLETLPNGLLSVLGRYGYVLRHPSTTRIETV